MIGVSLATEMIIFGFLVAVSAMKHSAAMGQADEETAFAIVPLSGILFFAVVFALAIANTRLPETHKRLMLLASVSILDAAVARRFLTFLAPPGPPGPLPVPVSIGPALVAYLLLVVAIVADWRTRGRPHRVYIYGGAALVTIKLLNWPISMTPAWHSRAVAYWRWRISGRPASLRKHSFRRDESDQLSFSVIPPSTTSSMPVTYFDSSEARNSAALATSQASPMCPIGTWASRARHIASTSPAA